MTDVTELIFRHQITIYNIIAKNHSRGMADLGGEDGALDL